MIGTAGRYQITATFRGPDGSVRAEDLGVHEASTGQGAKRRAQNLHASRLGWLGGSRGPLIPKGWSFKIALVKYCLSSCSAGVTREREGRVPVLY